MSGREAKRSIKYFEEALWCARACQPGGCQSNQFFACFHRKNEASVGFSRLGSKFKQLRGQRALTFTAFLPLSTRCCVYSAEMVTILSELKEWSAVSAHGTVFSKLCGRNNLRATTDPSAHRESCVTDSNNADFVNEMGCQLTLRKDKRCHEESLRLQMQLDETSVAALTGIINCQLLQGHIEEAAQQLEFLNEIQQSIGRSADLAYLSAVLAIKKGKGPDKAIELLFNESIELHFRPYRILLNQQKKLSLTLFSFPQFFLDFQGLPLGIDYFCKLNPDFLLMIIKDYLQFAPQVLRPLVSL
ncbi:Tetratricopeptide repeat protein 21B [Bulinus truncatus]|nr:Tetratricopeptide repeat protein 21B [Bulinus truncatus]